MRLLQLVAAHLLSVLAVLLLAAAGVYLFAENQQSARALGAADVERRYRMYAEEVRDGERPCVRRADSAAFVGRGRLGKGTWGYEPSGDETLVWYRPPKAERVSCATVPRVDPPGVGRTVVLALAAVLLSAVLFTMLALRNFRMFLRERDDFIRATVHDLTMPLVGLRRTVGVDDGLAKSLADRLMRMLANLSEYLSLGGRRPPAVRETFDLRAAFEEACGPFREDLRRLTDGAGLEVSGPDVLPVCGDGQRTVQVIWNLLSNEIKYALPFGAVRVSFSADADGFARLRFADEGPGLSPRARRLVFARFYRAKDVRESGTGGFGLGLYTSRAFAREMGGDLTVAANGQKGCVFTLVMRRCV